MVYLDSTGSQTRQGFLGWRNHGDATHPQLVDRHGRPPAGGGDHTDGRLAAGLAAQTLHRKTGQQRQCL
ncbi:hypothetical protein D9M68_850100 [compost metagenome]